MFCFWPHTDSCAESCPAHSGRCLINTRWKAPVDPPLPGAGGLLAHFSVTLSSCENSVNTMCVPGTYEAPEMQRRIRARLLPRGTWGSERACVGGRGGTAHAGAGQRSPPSQPALPLGLASNVCHLCGLGQVTRTPWASVSPPVSGWGGDVLGMKLPPQSAVERIQRERTGRPWNGGAHR